MKERHDHMTITLCGSARFEEAFKNANVRLTLAGHTVYSLAAYPSDMGGLKDWYSEEQKAELDRAHLRKIDNSEAIYVIAPGGYVGESTAREIAYAKKTGKLVMCAYPLREADVRTCPYAGCPQPVQSCPCAICYE